MKSFKLLPRLITGFGLVMMFGVSGWGANVDLNLSKTAPSTVIPGASLAYTLTARNNTGNKDLSTVKIVDTLPLGVSYSSRTGINWTCSATAYNATVAQVVTCTLGVTLNRNTTAQVLTINTTAPSSVGSITNYAVVSQTGDTETTPNDNNATATTTVQYSYTADNLRPFTMAYTSNEKGNIKIVGNSVFLDNGSCATGPNNAVTNPTYAKKDTTTDDDSYLNSTMATLNLPGGVSSSSIKYAALTWQGRLTPTTIDNNGVADNAKKVRLKLPGISGGYQEINSSLSKFNWSYNTNGGGNGDDYQGVADITTLLQQSVASHGNASGYIGDIWVANIFADLKPNSSNAGYGAWSIVIAYHDDTTTLKNLTVYDGYLKINDTISESVPLSGFLTPTSGDFNASFLIFGGEGDVSFGDRVSLTNKAGTTKLLSTNGEVFTSSITNEVGSNVTTRNPDCANTIGIDIHSFNIGKGSSLNIIENSQTSTTVKLEGKKTYTNPAASFSDYDTHFPGVFAFATDLYQPQVCYIENIFKGTTNISGLGVQVNKDDNLTVRVYIKNTGNDNAEKVQILHQFESSKFPYVANSANYNNSNPPYEILMPPLYTRTVASDSSANDLYEYNTTSLISKVNLGVLATSGDGGLFYPTSSGTPTYAVYEYNASVKVLDVNYSNIYKAAYKNVALGIDYSNNPVTMQTCDGSQNSFYGYSAPVSATGDFNVVYHSNWPNALGNYYYNLPTAIASRADNYKVIALSPGTDNLKDMNTTVAVELVDASSGTCSTHTPISDVKTWIPFNNSSTANFSAADIINGVILADSQAAIKFYKKAGKNVKFRISYPNDGSGGVIIMKETVPGKFHLANFPSYAGNTCVSSVTATTYNPSNGNIQGEATYTQVPQACGNAGASGASAMTQHEVNVCLECIYGVNKNYACSRDNFAIRPEAFYVKLNDQNQTNFVTKQAMSNNISGAVSLNLASGYQYYAEVNATNHVDNNATSGYTTTEGLDSIWNPVGVIESECNDDTNKSSVLNFVNGSVEANLSVDQVGIYALNITDDTWANVDSNVSTMTHHTSPFFLSGTDCTPNSAVTSTLGSYNGCNISSNHVNSDAGITYTDTIVRYRPYDFNLSSIQMSKGQGFGGTIMGQNAWTYMNSVNIDENMSIRYFGPIRPVGKTGTLLSNYVDNCYAQPVNMDINLTFPVTAGLLNWRYRLQEVNATTVWRDTNAIIAAPATNISFPLVAIPQTSFLKNQNGLADMNLSLNFDRNQTIAVNPITVGLKNFQIKCQVPGNCSSRADFSTTHLPDANVTTDNNTTFVYGRVIPRDVRIFGSVPFTANGWYEVFNVPTIGATTLPASKNDATWYTNTLHLQPSDGSALVTVVPGGNLPNSTTYANGVVNYNFNAINLLSIPYSAKAHIDTDPWLWYGTNALSYLDPANPGNLDCMTHPCFNINVVPAVGATGSAKSGAETKKASKKSTSEVGAGGWKSTSDYAPAIR